MQQVYIETTDDDYLLVIDPETEAIIAKHKIEFGKGKLVQDTCYKRDFTKGINTYIDTVASGFSDKDKAIMYLNIIRKKRSRYIRDPWMNRFSHMILFNLL